MSDGITELERGLARLDPSSPTWPGDAASVLSHVPVSLDAVAAYIEQLEPEVRAARFEGSHETSTHFKWLVSRHERPRFTIWLHDYKPESERRHGYAEVAHDHRYDLASVILAGGYTAEELEANDDGSVVPVASARFDVGDVMRLGADAIHRLTAIDEGTITLMVEGEPKRHSSTAYYPDEPRVRTFLDFTGRWPELRSKLGY
jgi:hypothetical protein